MSVLSDFQSWDKGMNTAPRMFGWTAPDMPEPVVVNKPALPTNGKLEAFSQQLQREKIAGRAAVSGALGACPTDSPYDKKSAWIKSTLQSPILIALLAGIVVMLVLAVVRPPFVTKRSDNPIHRPSSDPTKIIVWGLIAAVTVFAIPMIVTKTKVGCSADNKTSTD